MEASKLISSLERALIEAANPQSNEDQAKAKRLIRRLQICLGEESNPMDSGMLEVLGLPHPDDIPRDAQEEKEWNIDRFVLLEGWLKAEFDQASTVTLTQQALERKFGFRGDILQILKRRALNIEKQFYHIQEGSYKLDGKPEVTFIRTN